MFWKEHSGRFPRLSFVAKQVLSAPSSIAGIKRLFSVVGCVLNPRTTEITDSSFEDQLFGIVNFDFHDNTVKSD